MCGRQSSVQEVVLGAGTARALLRRGQIHQVRLETRGGQALIGARVAIDVASAVPGVLKAPLCATACATALAAKCFGLQIVVERDE